METKEYFSMLILIEIKNVGTRAGAKLHPLGAKNEEILVDSSQTFVPEFSGFSSVKYPYVQLRLGVVYFYPVPMYCESCGL